MKLYNFLRDRIHITMGVNTLKMHYIALVLIAALFAACTVQNENTIVQNTTIVANTTVTDNTHGRVVAVLHDAPAAGTVTSVKVTIDNVEVFSPETGWTTIDGDEDTYDLLQLQNENNALLGDKILETGTYTQFRLKISSIVVTDANGDHNAKIPSEKMQVNTVLNVRPNATAVLDIDFDAAESLHLTGNGEYIVTPVLHVTTYETANVLIRGRIVTVSGGAVVSDIVVSQDIRGEVGTGILVPRTVNVIVTRGEIETAPGNPAVVNIYNTYNYNTTNTYNNTTVYGNTTVRANTTGNTT
jgi:hypothetical protein